MGFIGVAVGITVGILIYSQIEAMLDCKTVDTCERAKSIGWSVMGVLPVTMFFSLFSLFGGFRRT